MAILMISSLSTARAQLPSPLKDLNFYTSNTENRNLAMAGDLIKIYMTTDNSKAIKNISINDNEIKFRFRCRRDTCVYAGDYQVTNVDALGKVKLSMNTGKKFTSENNLIVFNNTPVEIINSSNDLHSISNLRIYPEDSRKNKYITNGDKLNVSFYSSLIDPADFIELKIAGVSYQLADLNYVLVEGNLYKYSMQITASGSFNEGKIAISLKVKENDKVVNVNKTSDGVNIAYRKPNNVPTFEDSLAIFTDNKINNRIYNLDDNAFVRFKTNLDYEINSLKVGGKEYKSELQTSCSANNTCNHFVKLDNFNLNNSDLLAVELDYKDQHKNFVLNPAEKVAVIDDFKTKLVADRLTFGMNQEVYDFIKQNGYTAFIDQQLNPASIDDSEFENNIPFIDRHMDILQNMNIEWLYYMLNTKKQLNERMTWFWENHFNTNSNKFRSQGWWSTWGDSRARGVNVYKRSGENDTAFSYEIGKLNIDTSLYDQFEILVEIPNVYDDETTTIVNWTTDQDSDSLSETTNEITIENTKDNKMTIVPFSDTGILQNMAIEPGANKDIVRDYIIKHIALSDSTGVNPKMVMLENIHTVQNNDHKFYRENALGNFKDLVLATSHMPHMLYYLDNYASKASSLNENYAREILELHTLGVNGGYTEEDIRKVASILTGWTIVGSNFYYSDNDHHYNVADLSFLDQDIAWGGYQQGLDLLDAIAKHPSTADHICTKLHIHFINEIIDNDIKTSCVDTFLANVDDPQQIAKVLGSMFKHPNFVTKNNYRSKVATPHLYILQMLRKSGLKLLDENHVIFERLFSYLTSQNHIFSVNPRPTGYDEASADWFNPNQFYYRIRFTRDLINRVNKLVNIQNIATHDGLYNDTDEMINYILYFTVGDDYTKKEFDYLKSLVPNNFKNYSKAAKDYIIETIMLNAYLMPRAQMY
jgi:uncharacterized protein (DUF1800 family)